MPASQFDPRDSALAALGADASAACARRLVRVAGTHALVVDGIALPQPPVAGIGCWTNLRPDASGRGWRGPLRTDLQELPFGDESFCVVLARFVDHAGVRPEAGATELARVLANHGTLLIAGLHPRSLWRAGTAPGRWERALRAAGLEVAPAVRCGSPWPRVSGAASLPEWLVRGTGGAYVIEAHRRVVTAIPLRKTASNRRAVEHKALLPGARRESLDSLLCRAPRRFLRQRA